MVSSVEPTQDETEKIEKLIYLFSPLFKEEGLALQSLGEGELFNIATRRKI